MILIVKMTNENAIILLIIDISEFTQNFSKNILRMCVHLIIWNHPPSDLVLMVD